jgi:hypothetical protein
MPGRVKKSAVVPAAVPTDEDILNEDETVHLTKLRTRRQLRELRYRADGPPWIQIGKSVVYRRSAVIKWLVSREHRA